jgi:hypothetical protein
MSNIRVGDLVKIGGGPTLGLEKCMSIWIHGE